MTPIYAFEQQPSNTGTEIDGDLDLPASIEKDRYARPKLYKVYYDPCQASDTIESLRHQLEAIKQTIEKICKGKEQEDQITIKEKITRTVKEILSEIQFLYKNGHYKNEGEVRILAPYAIDEDAVCLDNQTSKLYVKTTDFLFQPGSKIIVGPKVKDPIKTRLELRHRLDRNRHLDVEVRLSKIKYR